MPEQRVHEVAERLRQERAGFKNEIHFAEVRGASGQQAIYRVARRWVRVFFEELIDELAFKAAVAVHDGPKPIPYPDEGLAYFRHMLLGTRHTFVGLTRFALTGFDSIEVDPVFDNTGNASIRRAYSWAVDQFVYRANRRRRDGDLRYPYVTARRPRFVDSTPGLGDGDIADDQELLQLTDVLLGAAETSLEFRQATRKAGRLQLAADVTAGMARHWGGSVFTYSRRARHFTVTLWPDRYGFLYPALPSRRPALDIPRAPLLPTQVWTLEGNLPR